MRGAGRGVCTRAHQPQPAAALERRVAQRIRWRERRNLRAGGAGCRARLQQRASAGASERSLPVPVARIPAQTGREQSSATRPNDRSTRLSRARAALRRHRARQLSSLETPRRTCGACLRDRSPPLCACIPGWSVRQRTEAMRFTRIECAQATDGRATLTATCYGPRRHPALPFSARLAMERFARGPRPSRQAIASANPPRS